MAYSDIYLYSPLSIKTVKEGHNRTILLQFILSEIFYALDAEKKEDPLEFVFSSPACFFPYDWSYEVGALNKISEHAKLLIYAFPKLEESAKGFTSTLDEILTKLLDCKKEKQKIDQKQLARDLQKLYFLLEPFIVNCKESEDLLLFLLKNTDEIIQLAHPETLNSLLAKMYPEGLDAVAHHIRREYQKRGFHSLTQDLDKLLSSL